MPSVMKIGNSRVHLSEALAASYIGEARRLREQARHHEAEAILREGLKCFPDDPDLLIDYARVTERRGEEREHTQGFPDKRLQKVVPHPDDAGTRVRRSLQALEDIY